MTSSEVGKNIYNIFEVFTHNSSKIIWHSDPNVQHFMGFHTSVANMQHSISNIAVSTFCKTVEFDPEWYYIYIVLHLHLCSKVAFLNQFHFLHRLFLVQHPIKDNVGWLTFHITSYQLKLLLTLLHNVYSPLYML